MEVGGLAQSRGMKTRSSVKKMCEGCKVCFGCFCVFSLCWVDTVLVLGCVEVVEREAEALKGDFFGCDDC